MLVALAFAGLGLTAPLQNLWFAVVPLMVLFGIGMGFVVSPLSTAVMTGVEDGDTGVASGVNNAVARVAGLLAVATMGAVVALVFAEALGNDAGPAVAFGMAPKIPLAAAAEAARVAATNAAFAAVAYITAGLSLVSALTAWLTLEKKLETSHRPN